MGKVVKKVGKAIGSVFKAVGNFVGMLFTGPKVPKATANTSTETRLQASLVPEENFKVIFGETAAGTDMRFWETYGAGNNGHVQVFAAACHEITGYGNLYLDEKPVTFAGNNATGTFAGLLSRRQVLKGISGASIALGSGARWTASSAMTGCAWYALIWNYNQEKLPNGIPSRVTLVVKGAKVYDPRRDSTRGGSGAHRADNPATWEYLPTDSNGQPIGRNNALQMLAYTLGIKALSPVTGQWELRAGRGADTADIDFDTFITAANACEIEGWYSDCILSTGDSHSTNEGILEAASGGRLSDTGGRFSYYVSTDDTANVAAYFTEGDIVGETDWEPAKAMSEQYNQLPGTFTDPTALFQTRPLPLCYSAEYYAIDGYKKRAEPEKLSSVQDPAQGQKLLRRKLNRSRYQGVFTATFNLRGLKVRDNSIVRLTFPQQGWVQKLFRVGQQGISKSGGIQLVLEEESPAIYLPGAVLAVLPPGAGFGGDTGDVVAVAGLKATPSGVVSGPTARDAMIVEFNAVGQLVDRTEGRYKKTGDANWTPLPPLRRDQVGWKVEPLLSTTSYTFEVRHITLWNVPSAWAPVVRSTDAVTINPAGQMVYSNGQTVDSLRPGEAGANITESRTSAAIYGQGWGATASELLASNANVPLGQNNILDSDFTKGWANFGFGWNGPVANTPFRTIESGAIKFVRGALSPLVTEATVYDLFSSNPRADLGISYIREYGMSVRQGDRVFASCLAAVAGGASVINLQVGLYNSNGEYIGEVTVASGGKGNYVSSIGDVTEFERIGGFTVIVPQAARYAIIWARVNKPATAGPTDAHSCAAQPFLTKVPAYQTVWPPYTSGPPSKRADPTADNISSGIVGQTGWATSSEPLSKISKLKNNGRSTSSYQVSNGVLTGATLYRSPVYILGSAVNGGAARITIAASTLRGSGITVSYSAGTIDGCGFETTYYVWIYDPDVIGGTVTYVATTDPNAYIDNPDYLFVGNIRTIAAGGTAPAPPPPPPRPPGYTDCVAAEAWLPTDQQAFEIKPGDRLLMLNERGDNMQVGECVSNKVALAPCMIFETVSGIKLTCSTTTPIIFKTEDGYGAKPAWECDGSEVVPVIDAKQGFRWEALACQPGHVGVKQVAHISANDGVYAAGDTKHGFMFTHNIRMDQYVKS